MRVHFIVHESFEAPGAYETWAINQGHDVTYSRVYAGDRLPDDAVGIDFLIVMGGPQDPDTTLEECPHFNAKAEQALIASAVKTGKAVIGICLGSQLIGEALGAEKSYSIGSCGGVACIWSRSARSGAPVSTLASHG